MVPIAVHISDGVLPLAWLAGGFVLAALLVAPGLWRLSDAEIPRLALFTSAFFVASLIHVRVGPTSVHLLLNGLVGVMLGLRAGLAVAVGLLLQAALVGHGGFSSLGVNTCVVTLPALCGAGLFASLRCVPALQRPLGRGVLVAVVVALWGWLLLVGVAAAWTRQPAEDWFARAGGWLVHPVTLTTLAGVGAAAAVWERRLENALDFPLGLLVGAVTVLLSVALNALVLAAALGAGAETVVAVLFVAHLPLAALEGVITGFVLSFLLRVAPHFLAGSPASPLGEREQLVERNLPLP
jgi:cobalt/nickel transport system permease protein